MGQHDMVCDLLREYQFEHIKTKRDTGRKSFRAVVARHK